MPLLTANDPGTNQNAWLQQVLEISAQVQHQKETEAQAAADAADREKRAAASEHYLTMALQQKNDFEFATLALEKQKVQLLKEQGGLFDGTLPGGVGVDNVLQVPASAPTASPAIPSIPDSTPGNFSASGAPPASTGGFEFVASAQTSAESLMAAVGPSIPMPTSGPDGQPLSPRARLGLRNTLGEADPLPSGGPDAGALSLFPQSSPVNEMAALASNLRGIPKKVAFPVLAQTAKQIATTAAKGAKTAPNEDNLYDSPEAALGAIADNNFDAKPDFNAKTGKYFLRFNSISKSGPTSDRYKEISQWPTVAGLRIDPADPETRYAERVGARGSSFTLATDKFHNVGGHLVRVPADGSEPQVVEGVTDEKAPPPTVQRLYLTAKDKLTEAEQSLDSQFVQGNPQYRANALAEVARRRDTVGFLKAANPALKKLDDPSPTPSPAVDTPRGKSTLSDADKAASLDAARAAIAAGKSPEGVKARLREHGIDPSEL